MYAYNKAIPNSKRTTQGGKVIQDRLTLDNGLVLQIRHC